VAFPGPCVEFRGDIVQDPGPVEGEVGAFREILPQQWTGPRELDT
jgi:hypothetical protein